MANFRILGQFVQYFLNDGTINAGGSLTFYQTDLTTLQNTWSDPALTILNPNPVPLAADGRLSVDVWGTGSYGVVLKDALGTTIQTLNNVQSGTDPGSTIPTLVNGEFLGNNGSNLLWAAIRQVPDPTGSGGGILGTDGTAVFWQALSSLAIPTITKTSNSININGWLVQVGSGSAAPTGFREVTDSQSFTTAFSATPYWIGITPTAINVTPSGNLGVPAVMSKSTTGFSVQFQSDDSGRTDAIFTSAVTYDWIAFGLA